MKRVKRYAVVLFLVTLFICMLVGCGEEQPTQIVPEGTYILSYYNTPGDSQAISVEVADSDFFQLSIPKRQGYTFSGLYDQPDGGTQIVNEEGRLNIQMNKDLLLYAQWEAQSYTFSFDAGEGELVGSSREKKYLYEEKIVGFPIAEREGYDFVGWSNNGQLCSDENGIPLAEKAVFNFNTYDTTGDDIIRLTAQWEKKVLTITFDYNDGSYNYKEIKVNYGDDLKLGDMPIIDTGSKELSGWAYSNNTSSIITSDITDIKTNMTFYGVWRDYKLVKFLATEENVQEIRVYSDTPYAPAVPERFGYEFDGWYESKSFAGNPTELVYYFEARDVYYAKWVMATYSINFSAPDDCVGDLATKNYTIESDMILPTLTRENYVFLGWCRNEDLSDDPIQLIESGNSGDITLYAKFMGEDRYVLLDAAGGTGVAPKIKLEYGAINTLPVPVIADYAFSGWYFADGTRFTDHNGLALMEYCFVEEQKLVAKYVQKHYITVEIPYAAGSVEIDEYYIEGQEVILKFIQSDNGYVFGGFYKGEERVTGIKTYGFFMPATDVHLSIMLTPSEYTLALDVDGGFEIKGEYKAVYKESFTLPVAYKNGYLFAGWALDGNLVTDAQGNALAPWTHLSNVKLIATYAEDTSGNPIHYIASVDDFLAIANDPQATYVLVEDLDFSNIQFSSIPEFMGVLEGNGHQIVGNKVPLFAKLSGTVRNLTISTQVNINLNDNANFGMLTASLSGAVSNVTTHGSVLITGDFGHVGALVGQATNGSKIEACTNHANISADHKTGEACSTGGIVGYTDGCTISKCANYGDISGEYRVGGIGGFISNAGELAGCENHGKISGGNYTGGIAGYFSYGARNVAIGDLNNTGMVTGMEHSGGIIGALYCDIDSRAHYTLTVTKLTNSGAVTGTQKVGGLFGSIYLRNRYGSGYSLVMHATALSNTGNATGEYYVGGLIGHAYSYHLSDLTNSTSSAVITAKAYIGGLAGWLEYIKLSNCSNADSYISATEYYIDGSTYYAYVGGYAGRGHIIENCNNDISITYVGNGCYVGGIAGYVDGDVTNCRNTGTISAPKADFVGGIVGYVCYGAVNVTLSDLTNTGAVIGDEKTGGIVGAVYSDVDSRANYTLVVTKLTNNGAVTGKEYVAGIIGHSYLRNRYGSGYIFTMHATVLSNTGDITGEYYVGGLLGYAYTIGISDLTDSTSTAVITAQAYAGGVAAWLDNVKMIECFNAGTQIVATDAYIDGGVYYAYVGGYAGRGYIIENCNNDAAIEYKGNGRYVGGIAGLTNSDLKNCKNTGTISAPNADYVGGIVGYVTYGAANVTLSDLTNNGAVIGKEYTGGIVGAVYSDVDSRANYTFDIRKLTNTGDVKGTKYVSGIMSYAYLRNRYGSNYVTTMHAAALTNSGDITGEYYVGGILGYVYVNGASEMSNSTSAATITAKGYAGGLAAWLENVKVMDCSNAGTNIKVTEYLIENSVYYVYVGGYVGRGNSVENCTNDGSIDYREKGCYVGGIAGYADGDLINCKNTGVISAPNADYVGGIAGRVNCGVRNVTLSELTNTAAVSGKAHTGGIVGKVSAEIYSSGSYVVTATKLNNAGAINGANYTGGIFGYCQLTNTYGSGRTFIMRAAMLSNVSNVTGQDYVGGLIGAVSSNGISELTDSTSSGVITGKQYVGGIAGNTNGSVINCKNTGEIKASADHVGGIVGFVSYGHINITLRDLTNTAAVTGLNSVGGIVGKAHYEVYSNAYFTVTTSKLINSGDINGKTYVAGIMGYCRLTNSYGSGRTFVINAEEWDNSGDVTGEYYVGGLMGYAITTGESILLNCTSAADVTAKAYVGGLGGWLESITINTCSNAGSKITATEYFIEGSAYYAYVGGYAGRVYGIKNCINDCVIDYKEKGMYVGGFAGYADGEFSNCTNNATVSAAKADYVGGIVGYFNYGATNLSLCDLTNAAAVTGKAQTGGIAGKVHSTVYSSGSFILTITKLSNSGAVKGTDYTGGILGYCQLANTYGSGRTVTMQATMLTNTGNVTGDFYVGGFMGAVSTNEESTLSDGKSSGVITGKAYVGGIAGLLNSVRVKDCVNTGTQIKATEYYVEGTKFYAYVGGYAGRGYAFENCTNEADVDYQGSGSYVGGIAGCAAGDIKNCQNSGNISASYADCVGGIAGAVEYGARNVTFADLINSGKITGKEYTGGIIGKVNCETYSSSSFVLAVTKLSNTGTVTGKKYTAGIVGYCYLNNSYSGSRNVGMQAIQLTNKGQVTGSDVVGGLFGYFQADAASSVTGYTNSASVIVIDAEGIRSDTVANGTNITFA